MTTAELIRANLWHHVNRLERDTDKLEEEARALARKIRQLRSDAHQTRAYLTLLGLSIEPADDDQAGEPEGFTVDPRD